MTRAQLSTARLTLRPVAPADEAAVLAAMNDLAVSGCLTPIPHPYTPADFAVFQGEYATHGETYAIEDRRGFVGVIGVEGRTLGYWLAPAAQGQGYATEAARVALSEHFRVDQTPIASGYFAGNHRSANVLAKLGFTQTGQGMRHCRALGKDRPHIDMSLTYKGFQAALPVQSSSRLTFRDLMPHDAPAQHTLVSQWEIASQKGSWPWPADYAFTLSRAAPYAGDGFVWGVFLQGEMIGNVAITKGELGYFIDPAHQRRGYGREAVAFAMAQSGLPRIEAEVWQDNPASLALLHSLGFAPFDRREHLSKARGIRLGTIRLVYSAPHP